MNPGKALRMNNVFRKTDGRSVIVAIDHGGIAGPIQGILKPAPLIRACREGGADAILTTRGFVKASIGEWDRSLALILRLTGEKVIDRHTASHYMPLIDIHSLEWSDRLSDGLIGLESLPRLAWSDQLAGRVNQTGAEETGLAVGTPVAVGAVDALSEAISVGAVHPGDLMIMYGSTIIMLEVMDHYNVERSLWGQPYAFKGTYGMIGAMATSGALTRWFRDQLARDTDFAALGIDSGQRAENLAVADYEAITRHLTSLQRPA